MRFIVELLSMDVGRSTGAPSADMAHETTPTDTRT
jgi:hypothetical protein